MRAEAAATTNAEEDGCRVVFKDVSCASVKVFSKTRSQVLERVSLTASSGTLHLVLGDEVAGKCVLDLATGITGLYTNTTGAVSINDQSDVQPGGTHCGYARQPGGAAFPLLSAREWLEFSADLRGVTDVSSRVQLLLNLAGLRDCGNGLDRSDVQIKMLTPSERTRLHIATEMMLLPPLLAAHVHVGDGRGSVVYGGGGDVGGAWWGPSLTAGATTRHALSAAGADQVFHMLRSATTRRRTVLCCVTGTSAGPAALSLAGRLTMLAGGRVVFDGPPDAARPHFEDMGYVFPSLAGADTSATLIAIANGTAQVLGRPTAELPLALRSAPTADRLTHHFTASGGPLPDSASQPIISGQWAKEEEAQGGEAERAVEGWAGEVARVQWVLLQRDLLVTWRQIRQDWILWSGVPVAILFIGYIMHGLDDWPVSSMQSSLQAMLGVSLASVFLLAALHYKRLLQTRAVFVEEQGQRRSGARVAAYGAPAFIISALAIGVLAVLPNIPFLAAIPSMTGLSDSGKFSTSMFIVFHLAWAVAGYALLLAVITSPRPTWALEVVLVYAVYSGTGAGAAAPRPAHRDHGWAYESNPQYWLLKGLNEAYTGSLGPEFVAHYYLNFLGFGGFERWNALLTVLAFLAGAWALQLLGLYYLSAERNGALAAWWTRRQGGTRSST